MLNKRLFTSHCYYLTPNTMTTIVRDIEDIVALRPAFNDLVVIDHSDDDSDQSVHSNQSDDESEIEKSYMITDTGKQNTRIDIVGFSIPRPLKMEKNQEKMKRFVLDICSANVSTVDEYIGMRKQLSKKHSILPDYTNLIYTYRTMLRDNEILPNYGFEFAFKSKAFRSESGVMVITVVASPTPDGQPFSCEFNCHYCPAEPAHKGNGFQEQPRSYIFNEPGVRRANRNGFDAILQFRDRARTYIVNGLPVDKIELIILGGTWHSYPADYRESFIRDLFYAANTLMDDGFHDGMAREKKDILAEHRINETSGARIIGVTIETRPDQITADNIVELRRHGVTRVQLGVQHTDDQILKLINRRCTTKTTIDAFRMLKDCGFKVDMHLMPDLPGSSVEKDRKMFEHVLNSPDLQADQWKIYPCMTIPWTEISKWYEDGSYKPYTETLVDTVIDGVLKPANPLFELLMEVKNKVHPWIRLNRVIRDIPEVYMVNDDKIEGVKGFGNMRQFLQSTMEKRGMECKCIRCREVKGRKTDLSQARLVTRSYEASGGTEYFLSYEGTDQNTNKTIIYGFLRLRLSLLAGSVLKRSVKRIALPVFPELDGAALIRELHVYGSVVKVNHDRKKNVQHSGFGSRLIQAAEEIAINHGYNKISVISGVGVRDYYRSKGYLDGQYFLNKDLLKYNPVLSTVRALESHVTDIANTNEQRIIDLELALTSTTHDIGMIQRAIVIITMFLICIIAYLFI
jgi:ELP3 family radical SAM enzyme/protein acetyltransferase